jgi:hypothetical protein
VTLICPCIMCFIVCDESSMYYKSINRVSFLCKVLNSGHFGCVFSLPDIDVNLINVCWSEEFKMEFHASYLSVCLQNST